MGVGTSLLLTALSAVNPALGLLGSIIRFVVDDRSSVWTLASGIAGASIDIDLDCDLGDFDAHPEICGSLVSLIPLVGLDTGLKMLANPHIRAESCTYCGERTIEPIVGPSGESICRKCLLDKTRRLHIRQSELLIPSSPHTLHIVGSPLLSESSLDFVPRLVGLRIPQSSQHPVVIRNRLLGEGIYRNRVETPRIRTLYL